MSAPTIPARPVADIIFEMEDAVADIERWAMVVTDLGQCENDVCPGGLFVIGEAIERAAMSLREQWTEAFRLTRSPEQRARR